MSDNTDLSHILNDRPIRYFGYIVLLLIFGVFGGWACLAPLDSAALAPGVITVKSYRKTVQHLEGGIVRELHVRDGDKVSQGSTLLVLDTSQLQAELEVLRNQKIAKTVLEARLSAELLQAQTLRMPDLALSEPRTREAWETEQALLQARYTAREGETKILQQSINQLEEQIIGLQAVIYNKKKLSQSHHDEVSDLRALLKITACSPIICSSS